MIVGLAVYLGIPLWLIAFFLWRLLRNRATVRSLETGFACRARLTGANPTDEVDDFTRFAAIGHWVHDVFVLHGGNPFLTKTAVFGVTELIAGPSAGSGNDRLEKFDDAVVMRFQLDDGGIAELACERGQAGLALGPFAAVSPRDG